MQNFINIFKYNGVDQSLKGMKLITDMLSYRFIKITHCYWLPQSAFNTAIPLDVNRQYIQCKNNSESLQLIGKVKTLLL